MADDSKEESSWSSWGNWASQVVKSTTEAVSEQEHWFRTFEIN